MLRTRWGGGVGWDVNVHVNLQKQLMLRTRGVGWGGEWGGMLTFMCELAEAVDATHTRGGVGGMGWDVNVHVNLQKQLMLRTRGVGWGGGMGWDVNVHVNLQGGKLTFMCELAEAVDATHTRGGVGGWDGVGC